MEIIIQPDAPSASRLAAHALARRLREKPTLVLGLATGSTPLALYRELIRLHRDEGLDFRHAVTFNLDEYVGLAPHHPASYHHFMAENFFRHVNIPPENIHIPDGLAPDIPATCARYEEQIRQAGGIDLQILGLGSDGHIAFNEPGSSLASRTRIKTLTPQTRADNARFFSDPADVPHHVLTMGVATILAAREIFLLAFGPAKAPAVAATIEGPLTASTPASALQLHPATKAFLDEPAATNLTRTDYYRCVFANKPAWQLL